MRLPATRDTILCRSLDDQLRLYFASAGVNHPVFSVSQSFVGCTGEDAVAREQVIDLAGHLNISLRHQDEVIRDSLKFGEHMR